VQSISPADATRWTAPCIIERGDLAKPNEEAQRDVSGIPRQTAASGRIDVPTARPTEPVGPGLHRFPTAPGREALLLIPPDVSPTPGAPLFVSLHGAGGNATAGLYPLDALASAAGLAILAPAAMERTWDLLLGGLGPDVATIRRALDAAFHALPVDPARLSIGGFSDGASYALSLGLANGDHFHRIAAFSPGFMAPPLRVGKPRIFISHGVRDRVLPIDRCSRRIVPQLRAEGYAVEYVEFDGGHEVPDAIARRALGWLLAEND
jgi:phospholipase/carboxylesterase